MPLSVGGRGGLPSNTGLHGPRPTSVPSGNLIHPAVWPQYTVTNRQTDRQPGQRSRSIGRTVLQTVAQKRTRTQLFRACAYNVNTQSIQASSAFAC